MKIRTTKKDTFVNNPEFIIIDAIAIILSFSVAYLYKFKVLDFLSKQSFRIVVISLIVINILITILNNPYKEIFQRGKIIELKKALFFAMNNFILLSIVLFMLKIGHTVSREVIVLTYVNFLFVSFVFRTIFKKIEKESYKRKEEKKNIIVVSYYKNIEDIIHNIENSDIQNYRITGICLIDRKEINSINKYAVVCNLEEIADYSITHNIDELFVAAKSNILSNETVAKLLENKIGINLSVSHVYGLEPNDVYANKVGIYNTLGFNSFVFSSRQRLYIGIKRVLDILISIIGILILMITMLIIKIINILSKDYGPLFYVQTRVGKDGKLFKLIKYRTMIVEAPEMLDELLKNEKYKEEWDKYQKIDKDPRITKIGKFLRKTSLDELPQFINVLKGEMSVVGPRPLVPGELKQHGGIKLYEQVKPGITGWWACNGRSNINYQERLEFEYYYIKNISFILDVSCILKSILVIIKKTGAQ